MTLHALPIVIGVLCVEMSESLNFWLKRRDLVEAGPRIVLGR